MLLVIPLQINIISIVCTTLVKAGWLMIRRRMLLHTILLLLVVCCCSALLSRSIYWLIDSVVVVICGLMVFGECVFVFVVVGLLRLHAKTGSDEWSIQNFYLSIYTLWASYSYQVEQMQFRCHSCLKRKYHLGPSCRRRSKNNSANMNYQNILSQDMSYRSHKIQKRNFVKRILYWLLFSFL